MFCIVMITPAHWFKIDIRNILFVYIYMYVF